MKIKLLIALLLFIIAIPILYSAYPVERAKAEKKKVSEESIKFLAEIGLTNSKTVTDNVDLIDYTLKKNYVKEYGVSYFSPTGLTTLIRAQDLVMGELTDYIGEIPEANITEFKANYERLKPNNTSHYAIVNWDNKTIKLVINKNIILPNRINLIKNPTYEDPIPWTHKILKNNPFPTELTAVEYFAKEMDLPSPIIKIIAPIKYFHMEGRTVNENNVIVRKKVDPMIIMEHEGGYLVLTSWFN